MNTMKKSSLILSFAVLSFLIPGYSIDPPPLIWQNPQRHYASLDQVRPVIANNGPHSIFLSSRSPNGFARLERWNEKTSLYESGRWTPDRAGAGDSVTSLEIKSHTEHEVGLNWQVSVDSPENPVHFIVEKTLAQRPIAGKYRFCFIPSPRPWVAGSGQDPGYFYISGSFVIGSQ
jgi:hypothetical protein